MDMECGKTKKATGSAGMKQVFGDTNGMKKPGEQQAPRSSGTSGKKGGMGHGKGMKGGY